MKRVVVLKRLLIKYLSTKKQVILLGQFFDYSWKSYLKFFWLVFCECMLANCAQCNALITAALVMMYLRLLRGWGLMHTVCLWSLFNTKAVLASWTSILFFFFLQVSNQMFWMNFIVEVTRVFGYCLYVWVKLNKRALISSYLSDANLKYNVVSSDTGQKWGIYT